jgi:hypothetical protein
MNYIMHGNRKKDITNIFYGDLIVVDHFFSRLHLDWIFTDTVTPINRRTSPYPAIYPRLPPAHPRTPPLAKPSVYTYPEMSDISGNE